MALDIGKKTLGLAFSDAGWRIASPLKTIHRKRWTDDLKYLEAFWDEYHIQGLVAGWPVLMDGAEGTQCHSTRHVLQNILKRRDLPCLLWDERLSTKAALHVLKNEADLSRQKRAQVIDSVAATWILQGALDILRDQTTQ